MVKFAIGKLPMVPLQPIQASVTFVDIELILADSLYGESGDVTGEISKQQLLTWWQSAATIQCLCLNVMTQQVSMRVAACIA